MNDDLQAPIRVLMLEDSPEDAELMLFTLRRAGLAVDWLRVETEGAYVSSLSPDLDVILADYDLPAFDACGALARLKESDLDVPLIVVSGVIREEIAVECMKQGAADYLLKDRMGRLGQAVEHAIEGRRLRVEKRKTDQALSESERRFRALIENSFDAIALLTADGLVSYTSPAAERIQGYSSEEMAGVDVLEHIHPEERPFAREALTTLRLRPREAVPVQVRIRRRDGVWRWIEGAMSNLLDEVGVHALVVNYRDATPRIEAEQELSRRRGELQALSRRLVEIQDAERSRLARELHDEIGQMLTGLKLMLDLYARVSDEATQERMAPTQSLVNYIMGRVREISRDLRPPVLDNQGLLPAVMAMIERFSSQSGIQVKVKNLLGDSRRFPIEIETAAFRLVQEALTNVARHAGVFACTVSLWVDERNLGVVIVDEGVGFDPADDAASAASSGLRGMRERVMLLDGEISIESQPGAGTCIRAALPLHV